MRIAYLDCASGIAGDMMLGALVDAGADLETIQLLVASLGLPSCHLISQEVKRCGFRAMKVTVEHAPEHKHRHLHHIEAMIDASQMSENQRNLAKRIFRALGEAEAKVHGTTIEKVHFHEVGAADSIADICGTAIGWDQLGVERLVCSPVPTGSGYVQIAHGRCAVPAPATAELLRGVPLAPSDVTAELTTPTGAAIIATLADSFGGVPAMEIQRVGYGAGDKDFPNQPNVVRLMIGDEVDSTEGLVSDEVVVLQTNVDDVSGEVIGYCLERLWQAGALDVFTTAITMKKNRPATMITVLATPSTASLCTEILCAETGTLGVRGWTARRRKLLRQEIFVDTPWGEVAGKQARMPDDTLAFSPEYEACRRLAAATGVPLWRIQEAARRSFAERSRTE